MRDHTVKVPGERGELDEWGGIVSARLSDWADALGTTPPELLAAAEREGIVPLVDTARPKGRSRSGDRERPTDPSLRCLAFNAEDARRLSAAVGDNGAGAAVPT